jgi:hypothetical protein
MPPTRRSTAAEPAVRVNSSSCRAVRSRTSCGFTWARPPITGVHMYSFYMEGSPPQRVHNGAVVATCMRLSECGAGWRETAKAMKRSLAGSCWHHRACASNHFIFGQRHPTQDLAERHRAVTHGCHGAGAWCSTAPPQLTPPPKTFNPFFGWKPPPIFDNNNSPFAREGESYFTREEGMAYNKITRNLTRTRRCATQWAGHVGGMWLLVHPFPNENVDCWKAQRTG